MEVDHVFIMTSSPEAAAERLQQFGLTEGASNVHPGQGTACRRFFFHNAYLELAWVIQEEEMRHPEVAGTKLWERAHYQETQYAPFGICFRKSPFDDQQAPLWPDNWRYKPSYLPTGQYANVAGNLNEKAEPMLFEMPFHQIKPEDYPEEIKQPLHHPRNFHSMTKVILQLPDPDHLSPSLQKVIMESTVEVEKSHGPAIRIEFDHGIKKERESFSPWLPLTLGW